MKPKIDNSVLDGRAFAGNMADRIIAANGDVGVARPYVGDNGKVYVTLNGKAVQAYNTEATLRLDAWLAIDTAIVKVAKERLNLVADLNRLGLTFRVPNGMGTTVLECETVGDVNDAVVSMDGLRTAEGDRPIFDSGILPLPLTHYDFHFSARQILSSRNSGSPIDTTMAELAARQVAEKLEKAAIGIDSYAYGSGTVYGLINYPSVLTQTLTTPDGTNGSTTVTQILAMRTSSQAKFHFGPWMIYNSPDWDQFLDNDFSTTKGDGTLRERILKIGGIQGIQTLDFMSNYDLVMVQMTSNVIRMVNGLDMTTIQWDTNGGMQKNFKVLTIQVPQLRKDQSNQTGIVYGSV